MGSLIGQVFEKVAEIERQRAQVEIKRRNTTSFKREEIRE